jgi:hypothetical protein
MAARSSSASVQVSGAGSKFSVEACPPAKVAKVALPSGSRSGALAALAGLAAAALRVSFSRKARTSNLVNAEVVIASSLDDSPHFAAVSASNLTGGCGNKVSMISQ